MRMGLTEKIKNYTNYNITPAIAVLFFGIKPS